MKIIKLDGYNATADNCKKLEFGTFDSYGEEQLQIVKAQNLENLSVIATFNTLGLRWWVDVSRYNPNFYFYDANRVRDHYQAVGSVQTGWQAAFWARPAGRDDVR